jgi:uncharacterized membrane-anchored protein
MLGQAQLYATNAEFTTSLVSICRISMYSIVLYVTIFHQDMGTCVSGISFLIYLCIFGLHIFIKYLYFYRVQSRRSNPGQWEKVNRNINIPQVELKHKC